MAIPVRCVHCGTLFNSNVFGGPDSGFARVSVSGSITDCPRCGKMTPIDGEYAIGKDQTIVLSAPWLFAFEQRLAMSGLTKGQAKQIQRKILKSKDPKLLPETVRRISPQVAEAVEDVIKQPTTEPDKWQWLYRIAAVVGIVAGVNTFSADYNIDAAIEWLQSHRDQSADQPSAKIPQNEPMKQPKEDDPTGPR